MTPSTCLAPTFVLALLAGCDRAAPGPVPASSAWIEPTATRLLATAPPDPCAAITAANARTKERAIAALQREQDAEVLPFDGGSEGPYFDAFCLPTPGGAWAGRTGETRGDRLLVTPWHVVHVDLRGHEVAYPENLDELCCYPTHHFGSFELAPARDGGEPVLTFFETDIGPEGDERLETWGFQLVNGAIARLGASPTR